MKNEYKKLNKLNTGYVCYLCIGECLGMILLHLHLKLSNIGREQGLLIIGCL